MMAAVAPGLGLPGRGDPAAARHHLPDAGWAAGGGKHRCL